MTRFFIFLKGQWNFKGHRMIANNNPLYYKQGTIQKATKKNCTRINRKKIKSDHNQHYWLKISKMTMTKSKGITMSTQNVKCILHELECNEMYQNGYKMHQSVN
jgi:hypothetical protein